MQSWLNYWTLFFWMTLFGFLFNPSNLLSLLFYSEVTWLTLYCYSLVLGAINDDMNLATLTFFMLGFAGIEYSFAFLLFMLFKNFNISFNLFEKDKSWKQMLYFSTNSMKNNKYKWASYLWGSTNYSWESYS